MRFELTTLTLARLCSTPELRPHSMSGYLLKAPGGRKGGARVFLHFFVIVPQAWRAGGVSTGRAFLAAPAPKPGCATPAVQSLSSGL